MLNIIVYSTLIGSIIIGLFGKYFNNNYLYFIIFSSLIIPTVFTLILYFNIIVNDSTYLSIGTTWISLDYLEINFGLLLDKISISVLIPVLIISTLVHWYSVYYLENDYHLNRYFSYLLLFTFGMIILVSANNYLVLFLGWELIGVASYLLISYWYTRVNASKSGLNSLLINRFGDSFMVIGISLLIYTIGNINYMTINSISNYIDIDILTLILISLLIGCSAKSVQFGLHTWLLNSMEGPTPVSSLLHAACLVIAGIYLLIRSSYLIEYCPLVLLIILILGGITTLISGLIAVVTNDIKRIIALSTMSQLGIMMVSIGISSYNLALYHLFCHSFFKCLLFMSSGAIIHSIITESQDIRTLGNIKAYLPLTYISLLIGSLSLMAVPGLTGFYSKDIIIESLLGSFYLTGYINYWICILSATLTSMYSIRLIYYAFYNYTNQSKYSYIHLTENSIYMYGPLVVLSLFSIFIGYIFKDIYLGMGSSFTFILPNNYYSDLEFTLNWYYKSLPLITSMIFSILLLLIYELKYLSKYISYNLVDINNIYGISAIRQIYTVFNQRLYFDQLINNITIRRSLSISYILNYYIDQGILMYLGPFGLNQLALLLTSKLNNMVTFNIGFLIDIIFISILLIIFKIQYTMGISLVLIILLFI